MFPAGNVGGRGGIRTHGGLAPTAVFKTAALNHSATLPGNRVPLSPAEPGCARRAVNQAGATRVLHSSLMWREEGVLSMSGWMFVTLSAVSLGSSAAPIAVPHHSPAPNS